MQCQHSARFVTERGQAGRGTPLRPSRCACHCTGAAPACWRGSECVGCACPMHLPSAPQLPLGSAGADPGCSVQLAAPCAVETPLGLPCYDGFLLHSLHEGPPRPSPPMGLNIWCPPNAAAPAPSSGACPADYSAHKLSYCLDMLQAPPRPRMLAASLSGCLFAAPGAAAPPVSSMWPVLAPLLC